MTARWWRCGLVVVLLLGASALSWPATAPRSRPGDGGLYAIPWMIGSWSGADGAPDGPLPSDPNAVSAIRRTYARGDSQAWLSAALFDYPDDPARRPAINLLYPGKGSSRIEHVPLEIALNGNPTHRTGLSAVIVHFGAQRLALLYWYQVDRRAYGGEYGYRAAILADRLMGRSGRSVLVRIGTEVRATETPAEALARISDLAPPIAAALSSEPGR
jgi:hypothetical protein